MAGKGKEIFYMNLNKIHMPGLATQRRHLICFLMHIAFKYSLKISATGTVRYLFTCSCCILKITATGLNQFLINELIIILFLFNTLLHFCFPFLLLHRFELFFQILISLALLLMNLLYSYRSKSAVRLKFVHQASASYD